MDPVTAVPPPGDAVPSDAIFRLMAEADRLVKRRRDSSANYEAMRYDLYADERAWLAAAYDPEGDDPHGWLARHPTLVIPLLEAYPLVRAAYSQERLLLARVRRDAPGADGDDDIEECHILDEEWEEHPPEIVVDREWFGHYAFTTEEEQDEGGRAMAAEDRRLDAILGDDSFGRAENWWGRDGAHGGHRVLFTPYCAEDFLDTDLTTNEELVRDAAHERELLAQPPEVFEPDEDDPEGFTYQPGSAEYLTAVEAEIARRRAQGLIVLDDRGLPLTEAEVEHTDRWLDAIPVVGSPDPLTAAERDALDAEGERLRAARIRRLYAERERRRAARHE